MNLFMSHTQHFYCDLITWKIAVMFTLQGQYLLTETGPMSMWTPCHPIKSQYISPDKCSQLFGSRKVWRNSRSNLDCVYDIKHSHPDTHVDPGGPCLMVYPCWWILELHSAVAVVPSANQMSVAWDSPVRRLSHKTPWAKTWVYRWLT